MKQLRPLRKAAHYSQQHLAKALNTTQQTIARWETGKAEPNLAALRDLALIFGTSVDDLLGINPMGKKPSTTHLHIAVNDVQDGFWGHVGIKLDDGPSRWFPVTANEATHVGEQLTQHEGAEWISFTTLANKLVAFRPKAMRKISLLDDGCDQPDEDWELEFPYEGLPLEIYRAFEHLNSATCASKIWRGAQDALNKDESFETSVAWKRLIEELSKNFGNDASEAFLTIAARNFLSEGLLDEEVFFRHQHHTSLHFCGGGKESFWIEPETLGEFVSEVDGNFVSATVRFVDCGGSREFFYSTSVLSLVVMPLIDIIDVMKREDERVSGSID